ncbi:hypothetical protein AQUCO_07300009v1 [Aquilegia coerulea]|uniref:Uncharacterized protein n=1 Tax=Aquilegia coerulea TaxID=218851 RepID=A0A2G5C9V0_AQUCA|nr:hypothetical protein AQUCO_07300009v1 [Aquilegia coerulea]PIA28031.1 hypothetical protein AQUCO_07300009v1 [Aquilegia coerulea]
MEIYNHWIQDILISSLATITFLPLKGKLLKILQPLVPLSTLTPIDEQEVWRPNHAATVVDWDALNHVMVMKTTYPSSIAQIEEITNNNIIQFHAQRPLLQIPKRRRRSIGSTKVKNRLTRSTRG